MIIVRKHKIVLFLNFTAQAHKSNVVLTASIFFNFLRNKLRTKKLNKQNEN
jgi:hypothetical protein